jgi:disulfide bond formation protein DsbB
MQAMLARVLEPARASLLLALSSAGILLAALALQYLGGLPPCNLCFWQRWPYVALIFFGLIGWRWQPHAVLGVATLVLLGGGGLAAYHVGVEQEWWPQPASCVAGDAAESVEDLKRLLPRDTQPTCDRVDFTFLGLSLAGWNLVASLLLAAVTLASALGLSRRHGATQRDPIPAGRS